MRLAAMFATSLIDAEAPAAAASRIFFSFLQNHNFVYFNKAFKCLMLQIVQKTS
jgi:hypothetical protein